LTTSRLPGGSSGPGTSAVSDADRPQPVGARTFKLARTGYIVTPAFDLVFFILSPVIGLLILRGVVLSEFSWATSKQSIFGVADSRLGFAIAVWTYAHLFTVVFRSHLNRNVFAQHRVRFVVVPIALFLGLMISPWVLAIGLALTWFWDIYHSSMQIFGFSRIYDSRMGNPADKGRSLDVWMAHFIYIAPVFVGLSLRPILEAALREFRPLGWGVLYRNVEVVVSLQPLFTSAIVFAGTLFVAYYIHSFWRLHKEEGYRYSPQKALMLVCTGGVSIYAWGFLHPAGAFFVVNFFHALQYFAMVWWSERSNIRYSFGLSQFAYGHVVAGLLFLTIIFGVGLWHQVFATHGKGIIALSLATVITLMHFWYDGFIWSVRKHEV